MGKTYLETIKYLIVADFQVDGLVEKPDVIGAIFGQSEGLLGSQLDIKELQQNGKIGRIEITTSHNNNKTFGTLKLPCSLSMVETVIIGASIESIDKVGPCDTRFVIKKIEDTRGLKRKQIKDRAIDLLGKIMQEEIPDTRELMDEIVNTFKTKEIILYGPDKLPAGPTVESNKELIIVEGRADVINMLKYGFTNVISTGGARIPASLADICKHKTVTLFLDGDRGADIQQNQLLKSVKVDFIARAPDGKEVEELTQKEINQALRRRIKSNILEVSSSKEKYNNNYNKDYKKDTTDSSNIIKHTKFSATNDHKVITKSNFENINKYKEKTVSDFSSMLSNIPDVERIDVTDNQSYNRHKPNNKPYDNRNNYKNSRTNFKKEPGTFKPNDSKSNDFNKSNQIKNTLKERLETALKEFDTKIQDKKDFKQEDSKLPIKKETTIMEVKTDEKKENDVLKQKKKTIVLPKLTDKIRKNFLSILEEVDGKGQSRILNEKLRRIGSSKSDELLSKIKSFKTGKIYAVVTDLEITPELLKQSKEKDILFLVSPKSKIKNDAEINIVTYNELKK